MLVCLNQCLLHETAVLEQLRVVAVKEDGHAEHDTAVEQLRSRSQGRRQCWNSGAAVQSHSQPHK